MKSFALSLVVFIQLFLAVQSRAINKDVSIIYNNVELDKYKRADKNKWITLHGEVDVSENNIFKRMALEGEEEFEARLRSLKDVDNNEDNEEYVDEIPNEFPHDDERLFKRGTIKSSEYFKSQLNSFEQSIYNKLDSISKASTVNTLKFELNGLRNQNIRRNKALEHTARAIGAVVRDHPEYWWIKQFSLSFVPSGNYISDLKVSLPASYSISDINKYNVQIKDRAKDIASKATKYGDKSAYKKLLYLHDYLATFIKYTDNHEYSFNLLGALVEEHCVCEGYAEAFAYIARLMNIPVICVTSTTHKWNYVYLKPDWFAVDVTYDDPTINGVTPNPGVNDNITRDFFLVGRDTVIRNSRKTYTTYSDRNVVDYVEFTDARGFKFPTLASGSYKVKKTDLQ